MITKPKQRCFNLNNGDGLELSIVDQFFHYRNQLNLAKEAIKLLEQQRTLYRILIEQCRCWNNSGRNSTGSLRKELQKLDDQLHSIYQRCDFYCSLSTAKGTASTKATISWNPLTISNLDSSITLLNSPTTTTMLGIDMKTFLYNQYLSSESSSSNASLKNNSLKITRSIRTSKRSCKFKCSMAKCRFASFTERGLIKHQLQHQREQLLEIIEPHGFTITKDNSKIIPKESKDIGQNLIQQCCFPFCNHKFPNRGLTTSIIDHVKTYVNHFQEHIASYILHPCFNCLKMFDSKQKLEDHFRLQVICKLGSQKFHFTTSDQLDSLDIEDVTETTTNHKLFKCKLCPENIANYYTNRKLFNLHSSLLHSRPDQDELIEGGAQNISSTHKSQQINLEETRTAVATIENQSTQKNELMTLDNNTSSIYCKLCKKLIFSSDAASDSDDRNEILFQLKHEHAKKVHNFDDEFLLADFIYSSNSLNQQRQEESDNLEESITSNFVDNNDMIVDDNIGLEVFIENDIENEQGNSNDKEELNINNPTIPNSNDNFLIPNPQDHDNNEEESQSPAAICDDTISQVFQDYDHTYNIEPPEQEPESEQRQQILMQQMTTDDHEDYTKNMSNAVEIPSDSTTSNHSVQYEVLFEHLPSKQVENMNDSNESSIVLENTDSVGNITDLINITAETDSNKILVKSSDSNEYVVMDVESIAELLLKTGADVILTSEDAPTKTAQLVDYQYQKPETINDPQQQFSIETDLTTTTEHPPAKNSSILEDNSITPKTSKGNLVEKNRSSEIIKDSLQLKQLMNIYIYECSICPYSFRSEKELSIHNYLVHSIASYHCPNCDYVTQDTEKYHRHEVLHKKIDSQSSSITGESQSDWNNRISSTLFVCTICSESFESDSELRWHANQNHQTFRCEICNVVVANRYILSSHMRSFHRDAFRKCDFCNYKTFNEFLYEAHRRKHTDYKRCPFEDCADTFASEDSLEAHVNKFHKMIKPYACEDCSEKFYSQKILNKHLIKQHQKFLYNCNQCNFKTNNHRNYLIHQKCHSSEKPFQCTERGCFNRFRTNHQLASHLRHKHTQVRDFKCDYLGCKRMFKTKTQLKQHSKTHSQSNITTDSSFSTPKGTTSTTSLSNKKPNIQYYIFGGSNLNVFGVSDNLNSQQPEIPNQKVEFQPNRKQSDTISNGLQNRSTSNSRSLVIKPALLRPSSINSTSTAILTTTISPIDDDDSVDSER